jgi:hypothetical protein
MVNPSMHGLEFISTSWQMAAVLSTPDLTVQFGAWLGIVLWPPLVMYYGTAPIPPNKDHVEPSRVSCPFEQVGMCSTRAYSNRVTNFPPLLFHVNVVHSRVELARTRSGPLDDPLEVDLNPLVPLR